MKLNHARICGWTLIALGANVVVLLVVGAVHAKMLNVVMTTLIAVAVAAACLAAGVMLLIDAKLTENEVDDDDTWDWDDDDEADDEQ